MKVGLIGGTGTLGRGLATRLASKHEVLVGSRDKIRGEKAANEISSKTGRTVAGGTDGEVAASCDVAILAVPDLKDFGFLEPLRQPLAGKLVISPIVPMVMENGLLRYTRDKTSAAEEVASVLQGSRVVAALHTLPAPTLLVGDRKLDFDVLVACDRDSDYKETADLIRSIEGLRPLYAGPLAMARTIERLAPLLINAAKLNGLKNLSLKFVW